MLKVVQTRKVVRMTKTAKMTKIIKKITYPDDFINKIICGDSLSTMKQMPDACLDLIVTSPPYNLKNSTGNGMNANTKTGKWKGNALQNGYADHDDNMPILEYNLWQHNCLLEMLRLIKNDGAIFYNHKWRVQGGLIQDRHEIMQDLPVRQIIIWERAGGINFNPGYFLPTNEVIYMITKPNFKLAPKANAYGTVWKFTQEMNNDHPAPFPESLVNRIISSTTASIILDPFSGSGTTAVVAKKLNRKYIGIELSAEYCTKSRLRIKNT
jgi:site-specific DNA-methyltransferase (adenine-specific)